MSCSIATSSITLSLTLPSFFKYYSTYKLLLCSLCQKAISISSFNTLQRHLNKHLKEQSLSYSQEAKQKVLAYTQGLEVLAIEERDRKSTRLNSSHRSLSRMPSSA